MPNSSKPPQSCDEYVSESLTEFQAAVDALEQLPHNASDKERSSAQGMVCLMSRSAYFDLFVYGTRYEILSESAGEAMEEIFQRAMQVMQPDEFKDRVEERHAEFQHLYRKVRQSTKQRLANMHMEALLFLTHDSSSDIGIADSSFAPCDSHSDSSVAV